MKRLSHSLLVLLLIAGSFPISARAARAVSQGCVVCGHVCCCPEVCAKKMEAKRNKSCKAASICKQAPVENGLAPITGREAMINPQFAVLERMHLTLRAEQDVVAATSFIPDFIFTRDIPTPPPRILS